MKKPTKKDIIYLSVSAPSFRIGVASQGTVSSPQGTLHASAGSTSRA